jgi:hypothetical protein
MSNCHDSHRVSLHSAVERERDQLFRQLFVEEQAQDSGSRNTLCAALALRGIGQVCADVFSGSVYLSCRPLIRGEDE